MHPASAWEPMSAPDPMATGQSGSWSFSAAGFITGAFIRDRGPRGDEGLFGLSMVSARVGHGFGPGTLSLGLMLSGDPVMGAEGYPHLLQTGETADGLTPLFDRQHPHDLISELALTYELPLDSTFSVFAYGGPVGDPALGPGPFMHRTSGRELPRAPISHHLLDGTHITHGVVTLGLVSTGRARLEVSAFNGREPDQHRLDLESPGLDSYSVRVSARPSPDWTLQGSVAQVTSPEQLHPGIDETRLSISATYNRASARGNWQTTVAFGRSKSDRTVIPVDQARARFSQPVLDHYLSLLEDTGLPEDSVLLYFPTRTQRALLVESAYSRDPWTATARVERVTKSELFPPSDARHSQLFEVTKVEAGAAVDVVRTPLGPLSVGVVGSAPFVPASLESEYGRRRVSWLVFTRLRLR